MSNLAPQIYNYKSNVISFEDLKNRNNKGAEEKTNRVTPNTAGVSSEVYAFRTKEEIKAMIDVFDKHINEAANEDQKRLAMRNKLLFVIGMNTGIRASDLRTLKWGSFFDELPDGSLEYKQLNSLQPVKQRKQGKFVKLFFNQAAKTIINWYIADYPVKSLDEHLFYSRVGDEPITANTLRRIIKDTAREAGIKQNIGSHSLRKTFGFWVFNNATDKNAALVKLQNIFNHSSTVVTMRYIGLVDEDMEEAFNSLDLGLEFL